jgi:hypothetical protein
MRHRVPSRMLAVELQLAQLLHHASVQLALVTTAYCRAYRLK